MQLFSTLPWAAPWMLPLSGGILVGLASWLLLASMGKVAGISGIASQTLSPTSDESREDGRWRWAFLGGLIAGGALSAVWLSPPVMALRPWPLLVVAGLLVGAGTVIGSGCTSGHGVCGLGRRSLRSLVATCVFMVVAMITVFATE
jgi:uncharacterized protein